MRLVRQALERFGLIGAGAPGRDGRGWRGWSGHASPGPGEMQHDAEPYDCQQSELVVKRGEIRALPPPSVVRGGILPGFGGNGISRRTQVHDPSSTTISCGLT
jgi:hypothetical protein